MNRLRTLFKGLTTLSSAIMMKVLQKGYRNSIRTTITTTPAALTITTTGKLDNKELKTRKHERK